MRLSGFLFIFLLSISGCASSIDPMKTKHGLLETESFTPIFISSTGGKIKTIYYKNSTLMYQNKTPLIANLTDSLIITDKGIFLVEWDIEKFKYAHKLELPYDKIASVNAVVTERLLLPNSQILEVNTTDNNQYNFVIFDGSVHVAEKIVDENLNTHI